jgi:hypothetical protein
MFPALNVHPSSYIARTNQRTKILKDMRKRREGRERGSTEDVAQPGATRDSVAIRPFGLVCLGKKRIDSVREGERERMEGEIN